MLLLILGKGVSKNRMLVTFPSRIIHYRPVTFPYARPVNKHTFLCSLYLTAGIFSTTAVYILPLSLEVGSRIIFLVFISQPLSRGHIAVGNNNILNLCSTATNNCWRLISLESSVTAVYQLSSTAGNYSLAVNRLSCNVIASQSMPR